MIVTITVPDECAQYVEAIQQYHEAKLGKPISQETVLLTVFLEGLGITYNAMKDAEAREKLKEAEEKKS